MNSIHSSSLTHYPVAYSKLQVERIDDGRASNTTNSDNNISGKQTSKSQPSSTKEIQAALKEAGLSNNTHSLPNNSQTQKALIAYTQNYNQTAFRRVAETISGIDLYA